MTDSTEVDGWRAWSDVTCRGTLITLSGGEITDKVEIFGQMIMVNGESIFRPVLVEGIMIVARHHRDDLAIDGTLYVPNPSRDNYDWHFKPNGTV